MNRLLSALCPALGLLAATADVAAQSVDSAIDTALARVPIHTAEADPAGGEYGTWAAGPNYKASFHGGFMFVPLLGDRVTEPRRWTWRTESVRLGATELVEGRAPNGRQVGEWRYEYDLGGVIEAYDVRAEGIEQTFVIAERPSGNGELVITGRVGGGLTTEPTAAAHAPVTFVDGMGAATVRYGVVTAVDAAGETATMTTACDGDRVELRLAAAALERLAFPLVVDPILTNANFGIDPGTFDVDIYHDSSQSQSNMWVVFSTRAAVSDTDLYVRRFPADFSGPGVTVFADVTANWSTQHGRLAGANGATTQDPGRTVAVFERRFPTNRRRVRWHAHDKNDVTLGTIVGSVPYTGGVNDWRPDVGGVRYGSNTTSVLLVMQREEGSEFSNGGASDIVALEVDTAVGNAGAPFGSVFEIGMGSTRDEERPSVNQLAEGGSAFSWVVAWQAHGNGPTDRWITVGRRISQTGGITAAVHHIGAGMAQEVSPTIEGADGRYLVTFGIRALTNYKPDGPESAYIGATRVDWEHGTLTAVVPYGQRTLFQSSTNDMLAGSCAFDSTTKSHWVVTYARVHGGATEFFTARVGHDGLVSEFQFPYDVPGHAPRPGGACFDRTNGRFAFAFVVDTGGVSHTMWGNYMTYQPGGTWYNYGNGCDADALLYWSGSYNRGSEFGSINLVRVRPLSGIFLVASTAPSAVGLGPYGMPGCELLVDAGAPNHLATMFLFSDINGEARLPLALPSQIAPFQLHCQAFVRDPAANAAGIDTTSGLNVPVR